MLHYMFTALLVMGWQQQFYANKQSYFYSYPAILREVGGWGGVSKLGTKQHGNRYYNFLQIRQEMSSEPLTQEVRHLVEMVWANAHGEVESILSRPVETLSLNKV